MDTEAQPTPTQENGAKIEESSSDPPGEVTNGKEDVKKTLRVTRQTRSRSRTPQKSKEKKNDDNVKAKKDEPKVLNPQKTDHSMNGHSEKNLECSETKDKKKDEEIDEKPKEQDNVRTLRSSEKKTDEKKESPKKTDKVNNEVADKESLESEKNNSETPSKKHSKKESLNQSGSNEDVKKSNTNEVNTLESEISVKSSDLPKPEGEAVEMDPLILATDEPDPELQFDENSDMESGKGSPIQLRCKTRRSHTRHIPTPKTPKSTDSESEKNSVAPTPTPENLNDTNDSINVGDISTRAEVGSDVSRLDYITHNTSITSEDNSYLNYSRERSLRETLRSLSPRKTIRPINDAYRQRAFKNNQNKSDLNVPYSEEDSVNRITGIKRRRSSTSEERKKFKADSAGFVSYLSSPLTNFKNKFITEASSSTPKLTGYKDSRKNIHEDISYTEVISETPEKKNWCAIM